MTETETRPAWKHKTSEELARWIASHSIIKITHGWEMTSADTADNWIELHAKVSQDGKAEKWEMRRVPSNFLTESNYGAEFSFRPDHARLVKVSQAVRDSIDAIDKFEAKNKRERAEFERLKRKFDTTHLD